MLTGLGQALRGSSRRMGWESRCLLVLSVGTCSGCCVVLVVNPVMAPEGLSGLLGCLCLDG